MKHMFTALEQRTLQIAKGFVGAREASGRNDGPIVSRFQRFVANGASWLLGKAWCVCFVLYCVKAAAWDRKLRSRLPLTASSSVLYQWFKREGLLLPRPIPGCIGMLRGGETGHRHTFLVHDVEDLVLVTVEGNLRNGVRWNRRPISGCDFGAII
jgi:hypothetical protein